MTTFSNATVNFAGYAPGIYPIQNLPAMRRIVSTTIQPGAHLILDGSVMPADGAGGLYVWAGTLVAPDDGSSTVKPDDLGPAEPGRWVLIALSGASGQTVTLTEVSAASVANPTAGRQVLFIDGADHKLKRKDFGGVVTVIG